MRVARCPAVTPAISESVTAVGKAGARAVSPGNRAPPPWAASGATASTRAARGGAALGMQLLHGFGELGQHLEKITDHPVVRDLEDRRVLVLVDGDDDLRGPHPREVLDRARD